MSCLWLSGCGWLPKLDLQPERAGWQGETPILAVYLGSTLSSRLPEGTYPPAVIAAGDQALGAAGYVVTARDSTGERGRVVARAGTSRLGPKKFTITARKSTSGTLVDITAEPGGSEVISRELLERMLTRLGL